MKHIFLFFLYAVAGISLHAQPLLFDAVPAPRHEIRAVWLTTLGGLDWPHTKATTPQKAEIQRQELCDILDRLQQGGINTVIFQARIRATTAYPSAIEPWDGAFTGTPGKQPPYDPLRFAIEECHKRHMELHAWLVAFPICKTTAVRQLGTRALPRQHPELCRLCGDQWMMDPGVPGTADYLAALCGEIVRNYDVDGIHLDYIRYPEEAIPWNDRRTYKKYGHGMPLSDWRRANVTRVVRRIHDTVRAIRPWVKLSCSPVGKYADLPRQSSYGWNARDAVSQEAQEWLKDGLMDWLFPMMYFDGKHFYPFAQDWQENAGAHPVASGLGIYFLSPREKDWPLSVITRQLYFMRNLGMGGAAFFRSKFLTDNVKGIYDFLANDFYRRPALTPPMPQADSVPPAPPRLKAMRKGYTLMLSWDAVAANTPVRYNVWRLDSGGTNPDSATLIAAGIEGTEYSCTPALPTLLHTPYAVTAVNAYGHESAFVPGVNTTETLVPTGSEPTADDICIDSLAPEVWRLQIADITGRTVCDVPRTQHLDTTSLAPGYYELRAVGRRKHTSHIVFFRKE